MLSDLEQLRSSVPADMDQGLVGTIGYLTLPVTPDSPGEVVLPVRGGTEAFAAFADEPIAKHARIVVVECRSARSVTVTPA